ncbi:DUF6334 family protein [Rhizorhabdus phycosphaerae]|uniref:DUF6334 family protein n=1 Tax=Rhizorhabdus phycosphaerae TaxID=2711156 RepID=UPI0013ED77FF|nr:DUF6334 family protein [Rhizorhabdus phycosphaerae]
MLQFDWEEVQGATVEAVVAKGVRGLSDGRLECEEIALVVGSSAVILRVNDDTDEVIVSLEPFGDARAGWQTLEQLQAIVARRLGWCWEGRNYRGYLDTFTMAVDGIDPAYSFTGMASALQCMRVTPITA